MKDHISRFQGACFIACPYRCTFKPYRLLLGALGISVSDKRPNHLSADRVGLRIPLVDFFFLFALSNGTPLEPRAVLTLATAFPNPAIHPHISSHSPPSFHPERIQLKAQVDHASIGVERNLVFRGINGNMRFWLGQFARDFHLQNGIAHGQIIRPSHIHRIAVNVHMLDALVPVFEQLSIRMKHRAVGDEEIGFQSRSNASYPIFCANQSSRNFGQCSQCRRFRQTVADGRPNCTAHLLGTPQTIRRQRKWNLSRMDPCCIGRSQLPMLQFIQPNEPRRIRIAHIISFRIIKRQHQGGIDGRQFV